MNAVMETAAAVNSPVIIQFSHSGGAFVAGKSVANDGDRASILGSLAGADHVNRLAAAYGARVILHTDHCAKKLLGWVDGLLDEGEKHFELTGKPLFSSHMLDLSEEPLEENVAICKRYLERMSAIDMTLEVELGITGGEEDGVDNSDADESDLYTKPEEVAYVYEELSQVSDRFTIAAAFGNVHGVYKPGNVKLKPTILRDSQEYVSQREVRHSATSPRLRVPRRVGLVARRDRRGDQLRRGQDEHRHRPAVGVLGRHPRVRGRQARLPAGPDRQPRGRRQAEQEGVRPAGVAARRREAFVDRLRRRSTSSTTSARSPDSPPPGIESDVADILRSVT
jgi:ketose-bisphosphate aldolase